MISYETIYNVLACAYVAFLYCECFSRDCPLYYVGACTAGYVVYRQVASSRGLSLGDSKL